MKILPIADFLIISHFGSLIIELLNDKVTLEGK